VATVRGPQIVYSYSRPRKKDVVFKRRRYELTNLPQTQDDIDYGEPQCKQNTFCDPDCERC
jgi:hypothetical protein